MRSQLSIFESKFLIRRNTGTGWAGTTHWIDPSAGVAGVMGTQLICAAGGSRDAAVRKAQTDFEEAFYALLTQTME